jgi:hypothetical protein
MNIIRVKTFVKDHQTTIALATGVVVGALAVYSYYHGKTLLELPANAAKHMAENGASVLYEVPNQGNFLLKYIPNS